MPRFLNTEGMASIAIAICDRCKMKRPYVELTEDGNSPGLRVCRSLGCYDHLDPYRKPPAQPDVITLEYPRPDVDIALTD